MAAAIGHPAGPVVIFLFIDIGASSVAVAGIGIAISSPTDFQCFSLSLSRFLSLYSLSIFSLAMSTSVSTDLFCV